jgi:hypothetical protein
MLKHEAGCPAGSDEGPDICTCGELIRWALKDEEADEIPAGGNWPDRMPNRRARNAGA